MKYVKLGTTGLEVSRICLGCMSYGEPDRGDHIWTLSLDDARPLITEALDAGINFFDTANGYSDGTSEEILGTVLRESVPRDDVVIATKVHNRMRPGPNGAGLSRKAILTEIDHSLRRLRIDYEGYSKPLGLRFLSERGLLPVIFHKACDTPQIVLEEQRFSEEN